MRAWDDKPGRRARLAALAAALLVSGCAEGVGPAVDWSLGARVGTRIEADVNRGLDPDSQAVLLTKAVNAGLVLDAETKRALFTADLGLAARYRAGQDELGGTGQVDPQLNLGATWRGKDITLGANAGFTVRPVDFTQIDDTGVTEGDAQQITGTFGLSVREAIDTRNSIFVSVDGRIVEFTESDTALTPTRTLTLRTGLERRLSETSTAALSLRLRHFEADNATGTRSQTLGVNANLTHQRTSRHTVRVGAGVSGVRTIEEIAGGSPQFDIGFTGELGFDYRLANWQAGLSLSQSIEPSSVGALQAFTRLNGTLDYKINARESLVLSLSATRRAPVSGGGDTLESLTLGPSYAWRLDPETRLSLGYSLRIKNDSTNGAALGHRVSLSLNREVALQD